MKPKTKDDIEISYEYVFEAIKAVLLGKEGKIEPLDKIINKGSDPN